MELILLFQHPTDLPLSLSESSLAKSATAASPERFERRVLMRGGGTFHVHGRGLLYVLGPAEVHGRARVRGGDRVTAG